MERLQILKFIRDPSTILTKQTKHKHENFKNGKPHNSGNRKSHTAEIRRRESHER